MKNGSNLNHPSPVQDKDLRMAIYQRTLLQIPEDCQNILRLTAQDITSKEIARQLGFAARAMFVNGAISARNTWSTKSRRTPITRP